MEPLILQADSEDAGKRLDAWLAEQTELTRSAAQKLAANVNGDRSVNLVDHTLLSNVIQKTATINQTTGKVV